MTQIPTIEPVTIRWRFEAAERPVRSGLSEGYLFNWYGETLTAAPEMSVHSRV